MALASAGLAQSAATEPIGPPVNTPSEFEQKCFEAGGQPFEILDGNGSVTSSICELPQGDTECNYVTNMCDVYPPSIQPTPGGPLDDTSIDPDDVGGIFVDDTPTVGVGTPTEPTDPQPSAQIAVTKYTCPQTIGYGLGQIDAYWAACTDFTSDVSFKLDGASTGNPGEQVTDAMGQYTWFDMEADQYFLTETVPSGYGLPVVFCATYDPLDPNSQAFERYDVSDEFRIEFEVADGESIICYWFNISVDYATATPHSGPTATLGPGTPGAGTPTTATPTPTPGTVEMNLTIRLFRCPPAPSTPDPDFDAATDCTDRPDGVRFELEPLDADGEPTAPARFADTGDPETGEATFSGIPPGDYVLTELDIPEGQTAFIMACESDRRDFSAYPFDPFADVAADGFLLLDLVPGESLTCDWYETPPGGDDLTIRVFDCPGAAVSVEACEPAPGSYSFVLRPVGTDGPPLVVESEDDGITRQSGLDGTFGIAEVGTQPCGIESDGLNADDDLVLIPGTPVIVDIFHCA
ncbi:MAG: prealbumin-like fold domain-containing protein [Chloroflexota bacterium]|nr:prealbumin-like fold domain-containing protein [Chloroflexota bacterium]